MDAAEHWERVVGDQSPEEFCRYSAEQGATSLSDACRKYAEWAENEMGWIVLEGLLEEYIKDAHADAGRPWDGVSNEWIGLA